MVQSILSMANLATLTPRNNFGWVTFQDDTISTTFTGGLDAILPHPSVVAPKHPGVDTAIVPSCSVLQIDLTWPVDLVSIGGDLQCRTWIAQATDPNDPNKAEPNILRGLHLCIGTNQMVEKSLVGGRIINLAWSLTVQVFPSAAVPQIANQKVAGWMS